MGRFRYSLAHLCGVLTFAAVGAAALANPTLLWIATVWSVTLAILAVGILAVVYNRSARRAFGSGFCLFGWGRLVLVFAPWFEQTTGELSLGRQLLDVLGRQAGHDAINAGMMPGIWDKVMHQPAYSHLAFVAIGQLLLTLMLAYTGGCVARWLYVRREAER